MTLNSVISTFLLHQSSIDVITFLCLGVRTIAIGFVQTAVFPLNEPLSIYLIII